MKNAVCPECGKEFERIVPWKIFCGKGCKFLFWAKKNRDKLNKEALKEANKAMKGKNEDKKIFPQR